MGDVARDAALVAVGGFGLGLGLVSGVVVCRLLRDWLERPGPKSR